jgi:predicted nucleotidyltransferase
MPFDTSVLDAALARRRANLEQQRQQLLAKALELLDELGPAYGIQQAYIFGSLAMPGRFDPRSDVDIAVEQIDPDRFFEAMGKFSSVLGRQVDLIELDKCHFANKIRRKGFRWMRSA